MLLGKQDSNQLVRVVWIDDENRRCYLVNTNELKFPYGLEVNHIIQHLETGEKEKVSEDPWYMLVQEGELTHLAIKKRDLL